MQFLGSQQDYGWFLVALAWIWIGAWWWRLGRTQSGWNWLPWSVAAGVATALVEIGTQVSDLWADQLVGLHPVADCGLAAIAMAQLAGWVVTWAAGRTDRIARFAAAALLFPCGAALVLRWWIPVWSTWLLPLGTAATAVVLVRESGRPREQRATLLLVAATVLFSTWGPVAEAAHASRRWSELNPFAVATIAVHLLATGVLTRTILGHSGSPDDFSRRESRRFALLLGCWLAAGIGFAIGSARLAQRDFAASLTAQADLASRLFADADLDACLGGGIRIDEVRDSIMPTGRRVPYAVSQELGRAPRAPLEARLADIHRALPDLRGAYLVTLSDGKVVGCVFPTGNHAPGGHMSIERQADDRDREAWLNPSPRFLGLVANGYGDALVAWAPLRPRDRMVGWLALEYSANSWQNSQAQARWQMFGITGLGALAAFLGFTRRLHERGRLLAAQQAESARMLAKQKSTFLAKVSHELRTPIQTILGYGEWIERETAESVTRNRVAALRQHAGLMLRLVNDLLDLGAIEAGSFRLASSAFSPARQLEHIISSFRPEALRKGLGLTIALDPAIPQIVLGDPDRFSQIALNLIGNAVKFTHRGSVTVRFGLVQTQADQDEYLLEVSDTGPGIPPDKLANLLQPFFQSAEIRPNQGSGLGLSLAGGLCRSMQGRLTAGNRPDSGATVGAYLRFERCTATLSPPESTVDLRGRRIVVADDNELVRDLFTTFLSHCGADCRAVDNGRAAVEAAAECDTLVLDLSMPELDGLEVTRRIRAESDPRRSRRIIGVSAHAGLAERDAAVAAGMDEFLSKPVSLARLAAAIISAPAPAVRPTGMTTKLEALIAELRQKFHAELPGLRRALAAAVAADRRDEIARLAHQLGNSAFAVQAPELAAAAAELEKSARAADNPSFLAALATLDQSLEDWARASPIFPPGNSRNQ